MLSGKIVKVGKVGKMVGVRDASVFEKVFKKSVGVTPSEYRSQFADMRK